MAKRGNAVPLIHGLLLAALVTGGCVRGSNPPATLSMGGPAPGGLTPVNMDHSRSGNPPPPNTSTPPNPVPAPVPVSGPGDTPTPQQPPIPAATSGPPSTSSSGSTNGDSGSFGGGTNALATVTTLVGTVNAPASIISNNGSSIISNNGSSIISDNGSALIGNNGAAIISNHSANIISNNGGTYKLLAAEGPEGALTNAFLYLTDRDEKFYFDKLTTLPFTATTDASGHYSFPIYTASRFPVDNDVIVNAALNNNLRLTGYIRPAGGANTLKINVATTLATEFLRGQAYRMGKALADFDMTGFLNTVSQTDAAIVTGDISAIATPPDPTNNNQPLTVGTFDFRIDHLEQLRNQYVIAFSAANVGNAALKAISDSWKALLGFRPTAVTSILGRDVATPKIGGSYATFGFATGDQRDANGNTGAGVGTATAPGDIPVGTNTAVCVSKGGDIFMAAYTIAPYSGHIRWIHPDGRITSLWLPTYPVGIPAGLCVEQDAPAGQTLDAVQETDNHGTLLVADAKYNIVYRVPIIDHAVWATPGVQEKYFMIPVAGDTDPQAPGQVASFYQQLGPTYVDMPTFVDGAAAHPATDGQSPKTSNWRASDEGPRTYTGTSPANDSSGTAVDPSLVHHPGDAVANPARWAHLDSPSDVKVDELGNIYIADQTNHRIRFIPSAAGAAAHTNYFNYHAPIVDGTGAVTGFQPAPAVMQAGCMYTIVGNPTWDPVKAFSQNNGKWFGEYLVNGQPGDSVPAQQTHLDQPYGIQLHTEGSDVYLYIAELDNQRVRKVSRNTGTIMTFAGNPPEPQLNNGHGDYNYAPNTSGDGGDGGPATQCRLSSPKSVDFDSSGRAFIVDADSGRIRMVDANGVITTVAGRLHSPNLIATDDVTDGDSLHWVDLYATEKLCVDPLGNVLFIDQQHQRLRKLWRQWE